MSFNEAKKNVIYVDQCGVEEAEQAITIPHSLCGCGGDEYVESCCNGVDV